MTLGDTEHLGPLMLRPIGVIRSGHRLKFDAPSQPEEVPEERNVIQLFAGHRFEFALRDLATFDRIWLLWWFHRNSRWRPQVLPPRSGTKRRGVFATRSPHRPNPIGLTSVRLYGVDGLSLSIGSVDLIDGTPILDIKPYLARVDSYPEAGAGWLAELEPTPVRYQLSFSPLAFEQLEWLKLHWQIDPMSRAVDILQRTPEPHRTRRISRYDENRLRMGCGAWRLIYSLSGEDVRIDEVTAGYPKSLLFNEGYNKVPDRDAQLDFIARWPDSGHSSDRTRSTA